MLDETLHGGSGSFSPDPSEVLRYLGHRGQTLDPSLDGRIEATRTRAARELRAMWVWRALPLTRDGEAFVAGDGLVTLRGRSMDVLLADASAVALMAVTLGPLPDRVAEREAERDPVAALVYDASANDLVEQGACACDGEIGRWARARGLGHTRRYSPGYGDLSLDVQPALLAALDARTRLGIELTDTMLMVPMKSITAVVGLGEGVDHGQGR